MKVYKGILKKVMSEEHYGEIKAGTKNHEEIKIQDTVRINTNNKTNEEFKSLPFRLSYKDVDSEGNDMYLFNDEAQEFQNVYRMSPIIHAYGKEMRILLEMEEYTPIKVVVEEKQAIVEQTTITNYKAICIQNQKSGLAKEIEQEEEQTI